MIKKNQPESFPALGLTLELIAEPMQPRYGGGYLDKAPAAHTLSVCVYSICSVMIGIVCVCVFVCVCESVCVFFSYYFFTGRGLIEGMSGLEQDRKSTRLNSSHT